MFLTELADFPSPFDTGTSTAELPILVSSKFSMGRRQLYNPGYISAASQDGVDAHRKYITVLRLIFSISCMTLTLCSSDTWGA